MNGLQVTVSRTSGPSKSSELCSKEHVTFIPGEIKSIYCDAGKTGRYVRIALPGQNKALYICEVEVYGIAGKTELSINQFQFQYNVIQNIDIGAVLGALSSALPLRAYCRIGHVSSETALTAHHYLRTFDELNYLQLQQLSSCKGLQLTLGILSTRQMFPFFCYL